MRTPPRPVAPTPDARGLIQLIEEMAQAGATDLHLKVPGRPQVRIDGALIPMPHERLSAETTFGFARGVMELAGEPEPFASVRDARVAFAVPGLGRFRAQVARQRGTFELVLHKVCSDAPTLGDYPGLDPVVTALEGPPGLFLVGGGRHRRGVIAAIIRQFNENHWGRLVSIEDPVDWLHRDARAAISQREVGTDVYTFHEGLSGAMRQDADAIAVSDMPTPEDADAVLRAAEEGLHLFAGLPVGDASDAVMAFVGRFPAAREREVASRVASILRGVAVVNSSASVIWQDIDATRRDLLRAGQLRLAG